MSRPVQFGSRRYLTDEEFAQRAKERGTARDVDNARTGTFRNEEGSRNFGYTSLVIDPPDGRVPALTPEAQARRAVPGTNGFGPFDSVEDFSNYDRCISRGVAGSLLPAIYGNGTKIEQAPGYVVIQNEMIHEARVIPLAPRPHVGAGVREWMGDSRGHFEGDTLVIETTNLNQRTGVGGFGNGALQSAQAKLVERLTRVDAKTIRYELTVDDPVIYTKPWTLRLNLDTKTGYEIYEYACHEGNYGLANMLSAARATERAEAAGQKPPPAPPRRPDAGGGE